MDIRDKLILGILTLAMALAILALIVAAIYIAVTQTQHTQELIAFCHENYDNVPAADIPGWCIRYMQYGR